jgi:hypothetical protein
MPKVITVLFTIWTESLVAPRCANTDERVAVSDGRDAVFDA